METNKIMSIYDEIDNIGVELSSETREVYSVLTAFHDALDEDLPHALQVLVEEEHAHSLHAYVKNELKALRILLKSYPYLRDSYSALLKKSLEKDLEKATINIKEQLSKLQDL